MALSQDRQPATGVRAVDSQRAAERGRKGGIACREKYGRTFYQQIGKLGCKATLLKHWQGDALGYRRWLVAKGWNAIVEQLADRELDRRINQGESIVCVEIAVLDEDFDPPF